MDAGSLVYLADGNWIVGCGAMFFSAWESPVIIIPDCYSSANIIYYVTINVRNFWHTWRYLCDSVIPCLKWRGRVVVYV